METYKPLTIVEQTIVYFLVWREMMGENEWYEGGIKNLASDLKRHIKSIREAIIKLQEKNMITTQKKQNFIWIKQTLSEEELYTRMAFISEMYEQPKSIQELKEDLEKEIERLEEELRLKKEIITQKQEEIRIRELVVSQISNEDIEKFVDRIIASRTYVNVNKSLEEFIKDEIAIFREEMFSKYEENYV
ncbi:MAG: hypothetical protein ACTSXA_10055 [Candidatus Heimdallarchaeota archaeon]